MPLLPVPIPIDTPIGKRRDFEAYPLPKKSNEPDRIDPNEGKLPQVWVDYLSFQDQAAANAVQRLFLVSLTGQSASIGATDLSNGSLTSGVYNFKYYTRITTPATIASSLQITLDWKDGGVTQQEQGAVLNANTTTTHESAGFFVHIDGTSPVRYAAAYVSAGATAMQYSLYVALERVSA